ncbi:TorD/DmsD family molecular chaperone [Providencia sneebia]|uniref:Uncharacterized protein n=1 Tax=Providencia sneebia DSM 19967 TaxID=1141660 RepID=K8WH34_9GAMM|nr:molecular chaperone [Providencia sneebia]EKT55570.1 hypothetical protein OO7_11319 [Providencia sneebia DSM 19967]
MTINTTLARILGACFYYSPQSETVSQIIPLLRDIPLWYEWDNMEELRPLSLSLSQQSADDLAYDFSVLFEGQGVMPAPPWGSVYLERDNIVMGTSTSHYRQFLAGHSLETETGLREPEDQFGLMLMALSVFGEQEQTDAITTLLEQFLLPWAYRYLKLVQETQTEYPFYPQLAQVTEKYLQDLQQKHHLTPVAAELFR